MERPEIVDLRKRAEKCRWLADNSTDCGTRTTLREMAAEYDVAAIAGEHDAVEKSD